MTVIDWKSLRHAYGPADDIPALLDRARSAPPPERYDVEPWFSLWSSLYHQNDIYSASYAAVPELVAIAGDRSGPAAIECLFLVASIELRRAEPQAPELPALLAARYQSAIMDASQFTRACDISALAMEDRLRLEVCEAVFSSNYTRAHQLLDEDTES
jgi:hypothetical protein